VTEIVHPLWVQWPPRTPNRYTKKNRRGKRFCMIAESVQGNEINEIKVQRGAKIGGLFALRREER
jgi:hypothetical protein